MIKTDDIKMIPAGRKLCRKLCGLLAATTALMSAHAALAMRVSPMVAEIGTTGNNSAARIEVSNEGSAALPFETKIWKLTWDENGTPHETASDDNFLVFPPQSVVAPNGHQVVRVQWVGDPTLKASESYYIEIDQLPVALDPATAPKNGATVQVVYHMKALLTVAPPNAESKVSVVSVTPEMIQPPAPAVKIDPALQGKAPPAPPVQPKIPALQVRIQNAGTRHAIMGGVNWIFDGKDAAGKPLHLEYKADKIGELIGVGYLPPAGGVRIFNVPVPTAFGASPVTLRFTE